MARHAILYTSKGASVMRNVRIAPTGEPLLHLDEDAVTKLVLDFASYLESGETISTPTVDAENVTVTASTTSPQITLTLSSATAYDLDGTCTIIVPISNGETFRQIIRVRRTERYMDEDSPRDYA